MKSRNEKFTVKAPAAIYGGRFVSPLSTAYRPLTLLEIVIANQASILWPRQAATVLDSTPFGMQSARCRHISQ
jgi:hypothetical protein